MHFPFTQLNVYAKFNNPDSVVRDGSFHVQAICDSELKKYYYTQATTKLFMACTLIIPAFFIITMSTVVRSFHEEINTQLALKQNHGILASLITVGLLAQGVIIGMDIAALYYVQEKQYEYSKYKIQHTINMYITSITFGFDFGIGVIMLLCLLVHLVPQRFYSKLSKVCSLSKGLSGVLSAMLPDSFSLWYIW